MPPADDNERRALGYLAVAALAVMVYVTREIAVGILLGVLTAFMMEPLYKRVRKKWKRKWLAQLVCLSLATFVILCGLLGVSAVLITRGTAMVKKLIVLLEPNGPLRAEIERLGERLAPLGIHLGAVVTKAQEAAASVATYAADLASTIATKTFQGMLMIFFLLLSVHFVLGRGREIEQNAEHMLPLSPRHTHALLLEFRRVGRAVLLGSVATGIAQGLCAGLIYYAVGLPEALFFGVVTAVASLFPGVGTMLVWVPAGIYFIATGHVARGVVNLVASAFFVIGFCDYVLRPRLVGSESMPALLTFAALFGGVEAFHGLIGLIVGPLVMSLAVAVLRLYRAQVGAEPVGQEPPLPTTSPGS